VWVEWKKPSRLYSGANTSKRLSRLVTVLKMHKPDDFLSPSCIGYVDAFDQEAAESDTSDAHASSGLAEFRFGVVFELPRSSITILPISLRRSFLKTFGAGTFAPPLKGRVTLAEKLAVAVLGFHQVGWLHKGISSSTVTFFVEPHTPPNLEQPWLTGFQLSRPRSFDNLTERPEFDKYKDLYRHECAQSGSQSEKYKASYDIYSLGVLLVEIALWRRIEDILEIDMSSVSRKRLRGIHDALLNRGDAAKLRTGDPILTMVEKSTTRVYAAAVQVCLEADENDKRMTSESEVRRANQMSSMLYQDVVQKLESLERSLG